MKPTIKNLQAQIVSLVHDLNIIKAENDLLKRELLHEKQQHEELRNKTPVTRGEKFWTQIEGSTNTKFKEFVRSSGLEIKAAEGAAIRVAFPAEFFNSNKAACNRSYQIFQEIWPKSVRNRSDMLIRF